jgi:hypothetical protein
MVARPPLRPYPQKEKHRCAENVPAPGKHRSSSENIERSSRPAAYPVWFLPLEDLSAKISAPFGLNLILIKSTFAQSFIAQQVIRLSATQRCAKAPRPFEKKGD